MKTRYWIWNKWIIIIGSLPMHADDVTNLHVQTWIKQKLSSFLNSEILYRINIILLWQVYTCFRLSWTDYSFIPGNVVIHVQNTRVCNFQLQFPIKSFLFWFHEGLIWLMYYILISMFDQSNDVLSSCEEKENNFNLIRDIKNLRFMRDSDWNFWTIITMQRSS